KPAFSALPTEFAIFVMPVTARQFGTYRPPTARRPQPRWRCPRHAETLSSRPRSGWAISSSSPVSFPGWSAIQSSATDSEHPVHLCPPSKWQKTSHPFIKIGDERFRAFIATSSNRHRLRFRRRIPPRLLDEPRAELAHMRLGGRERRLDDEVGAQSDQRLLERCDQHAGLDQAVDQRLTAERHAVPADRRLDHLLVLTEMQRPGRPQVADAARCQPGPPI